MSRRPILITGAHRSGSTWVGKMLGKSKQLCYIFEPFNIHFGPGICRSVFDSWFPYVTEENENEYYDCLYQIIRFKFHLLKEFGNIRTKWQLRNCFENLINFSIARMKKQLPLFKDPMAVFSADWLARRFDFLVLVLIRHPLAFAGSLKRLNWQFHFKDFVKQPLLMEGPLKPFKTEIEACVENLPDIIGQSVLLWKVIYSRVIDYQKQYPEWIFVRHEDISLNPVKEFKDIFEKLGVEFTHKIENYIRNHSKRSNPKEIPGKRATFLRRDSLENVYNWKKRLTSEEIKRIKKGTGAVASHFYPESLWGFAE